MTVSRKSKQVKDKTKKLKNKKLKNKKQRKNVTIKLQHVGGGPIDFIQWIFGKIVTLFTFDRTNKTKMINNNSEIINTPHKPKRFYLIQPSQSGEIENKGEKNSFHVFDIENPNLEMKVSRRFKLR